MKPNRLTTASVGVILALALVSFPVCVQAAAKAGMDDMDMDLFPKAPVDYGAGPGKIAPWTFQPAKVSSGSTPSARAALTAKAKAAGWVSTPYVLGSVSQGGPTAGTDGLFDPTVTWPLIGLHEMILPDGRVLNYGSTTAGIQGAEMSYDIWDPTRGTGPEAHSVLPNAMQTDIFCSGQSIIWSTGQVLITGGDMTVGGVRNYANNVTTLFSPQTNQLSPGGYMNYARWYPAVIDMPNNDMVALGGRTGNDGANVPVITPEVYNPATGWRVIAGAASKSVFGNTNGWYYPRAFLAPAGNIVLINSSGTMYSIDETGQGSITLYPKVVASPSSRERPTMMFAPGKLLSIRAGGTAQIIDISGAKPVVTPAGTIDEDRLWDNATVLADGTVLVNGGSTVANSLPTAAFTTQLWNPATNTWHTGAAAHTARLYHSIAILLPDATVLTGAGGAPGPVKELNSEIYYPPYLFLNDGSGNPAPRPSLSGATPQTTVGGSVTANVGPTDVITAVNFIRLGSVTHSTDPDARFIPAAFSQSGSQITASLPSNPNVMLPGYYYMFALANGVPSLAQIVLVTLPTGD